MLVTGASNYAFTGSGYITGLTALTVAGPGTLTIGNSGNNYSGGTNLQGGSIVMGAANGLSPNTRGDLRLGDQRRYARSGRP